VGEEDGNVALYFSFFFLWEGCVFCAGWGADPESADFVFADVQVALYKLKDVSKVMRVLCDYALSDGADSAVIFETVRCRDCKK